MRSCSISAPFFSFLFFSFHCVAFRSVPFRFVILYLFISIAVHLFQTKYLACSFRRRWDVTLFYDYFYHLTETINSKRNKRGKKEELWHFPQLNACRHSERWTTEIVVCTHFIEKMTISLLLLLFFYFLNGTIKAKHLFHFSALCSAYGSYLCRFINSVDKNEFSAIFNYFALARQWTNGPHEKHSLITSSDKILFNSNVKANNRYVGIYKHILQQKQQEKKIQLEPKIIWCTLDFNGFFHHFILCAVNTVWWLFWIWISRSEPNEWQSNRRWCSYSVSYGKHYHMHEYEMKLYIMI